MKNQNFRVHLASCKHGNEDTGLNMMCTQKRLSKGRHGVHVQLLGVDLRLNNGA